MEPTELIQTLEEFRKGYYACHYLKVGAMLEKKKILK
jgi:hypothetical protein